jgi:hypothetical protein
VHGNADSRNAFHKRLKGFQISDYCHSFAKASILDELSGCSSFEKTVERAFLSKEYISPLLENLYNIN